jgi:GNAT superfamily N-acetyltransferase
VSVPGAAIVAAMAVGEHPLPDGHTLWTLAERPDLHAAIEAFGSAVWPEFMLHDRTADRLWARMAESFPAYQLALLDGHERLVAVARSAPLAWDGSLADLPAGWDAQFERSVAGFDDDVAPDTLGAIMIVSDPEQQGRGLGSVMVAALQACARASGFRALIACVRPTELPLYPLIPIAEYATWLRDDGLPFDPWIRIHVRLGGRISRPEPASMVVEAPLADWESWTGLVFPASGSYVVPGACAPITIDRQSGLGTYRDPNLWIIHDLSTT